MRVTYCISTAQAAVSPSINFPFYSEEIPNPETIAHILLVEDNPLLQEIHRLFLEQLGYQVTVVGSGEEALEQSIPDYDAILMDIDLPGMNGVSTTRALFKKFPQLHIPVIACTTHSEADMRIECLAVGMVDYLQKPVSVPHLAKCLKENLEKRIFHS